MLSKNTLSKILNAGTVLAVSGVLLGSALTTTSWSMERGTIGDELGWTRSPNGKFVVPGEGIVGESRTISSKADLEIILNPTPGHVYNKLTIATNSGEMDRVALPFQQMFQVYPQLEELTLVKRTMGQFPLGEQRIKELANALSTNTTLKNLTILSSAVDDAGAQQLANVLKQNRTLQNLDLSVNEIGDAGAKDLAEALKSNTTLKTLSLLGNKNITDAGVQALAMALMESPNRTLQLDLVGTTVSKTADQKKRMAAHLATKGVTVIWE